MFFTTLFVLVQNVLLCERIRHLRQKNRFSLWFDIWWLKSFDKSSIRTKCLSSNSKRFTSCSLSTISEIREGNIFLSSYHKTFTEIWGFCCSNFFTSFSFIGKLIPSKYNVAACFSNCLVILYSGSCIFGYNSAPAAAREVFKPSTDSASLVVSSQKKFSV